MKKTQAPKKRSLYRETVRHLEKSDLRDVHGAFPTLSRSPSGEDCCITTR